MFKKKIISIINLFLVLALNLTFAISVLAGPCLDDDGDGYIVIEPGSVTGLEDNDGNYSPEQWSAFYALYKEEAGGCDGVNFKKGAEPARCDKLMITGPSDVLAEGQITGKKVNPGAIDGPNNGIDENCDGADGTFVQGGGNADVTGIFDKVINILGYYVVGGVSAIILLWGGVTYASAAGDDMKVRKARKAMIGAIIGLLIGIAAPSIINFVIEKMLG